MGSNGTEATAVDNLKLAVGVEIQDTVTGLRGMVTRVGRSGITVRRFNATTPERDYSWREVFKRDGAGGQQRIRQITFIAEDQ